MSEWTDTERAVLQKLIKRAESDPDFSTAEVDAIKKLAQAAIGLFALGRLAKWVIFVLAAIAGAMASWEKVKAVVSTWLGG